MYTYRHRSQYTAPNIATCNHKCSSALLPYNLTILADIFAVQDTYAEFCLMWVVFLINVPLSTNKFMLILATLIIMTDRGFITHIENIYYIDM